MVMPLRRGRYVTIAKLACSAFTARERTGFEEVDVRDTHTLHTGTCARTKNINIVKQTPV